MVERKNKIKQLQERIELCYLLRLAAFSDTVDRYIDIYLKNRINWLKIYALISIIAYDGSLTFSELGSKMLRPKDSITKIVSALVKDGFVRRYRNGKDRRSVRISITEEGYNFVSYVVETILSPIDKTIKQSMNKDEIETLFSLTKPLATWFSENAKDAYDKK